MRVVIKKPSECSASELKAFVEMVVEGGQVARKGLEERVKKAKLLAFGFKGETLAGIAAIKKASRFYISNIFGRADVSPEAAAFRYELGWCFILPEFRKLGLAGEIVEKILESSADCNLFGTTGANNRAMEKILNRQNFQKIGLPYQGRNEIKQLYVKKIRGAKFSDVLLSKAANFFVKNFKKPRVRKNIMNEPIRVLMITSEYPGKKRPHGVPFIPRQINALREAGVDVDLFHFNGKKKLFNYVKAWRDLREHTSGKTYDLVHAQWGQSATLALPKNLPWVITFRGNDLEGIVGANGKYTLHGRIQQFVSKLMARFADQTIVVSESLGKRLNRDDFHVIPSGLDLELFRPLPQYQSREKLGLPLDKKLILFAAKRTNRRKRFELAEAAVNLIKNRCNAELIVAADVPHALVPVYMNACDALLLTSMHEGSPNVVKEALACNLAVVATDIGDVAARIENIDGCHVCRDASPEAIAAKLEKVLSRTTPVSGREAVRDLDEKIIARQVIEVYKKALRKTESKSAIPAIQNHNEKSVSQIKIDLQS